MTNMRYVYYIYRRWNWKDQHKGCHVCTSTTPGSSINDKGKPSAFVFVQCCIYVQLSTSSQAKKWGAYFSAVCGWNSVPISATEAHGHRVCNRLLDFLSSRYFFFAPHLHTASARTWAFPEGFVQKQVDWICLMRNPFDLLLNKSFWKRPCPRGCCVHVWGKTKVPGGWKKSSLLQTRCPCASVALIGTEFHPQTAEK